MHTELFYLGYFKYILLFFTYFFLFFFTGVGYFYGSKGSENVVGPPLVNIPELFFTRLLHQSADMKDQQPVIQSLFLELLSWLVRIIIT